MANVSAVAAVRPGCAAFAFPRLLDSRGSNSNLQPFIPSPPPPPVITAVSISSSTITFHVVGHPNALFGALGTGGPGGGSVPMASGSFKRLITITQEGMAVEQQVLALTNGQVFNQSRICIRERTLRRM
jgi:hypothetical protein